MTTLACPNHRCREYLVPKALEVDLPGLAIICGACGTLVVEIPDPPES